MNNLKIILTVVVMMTTSVFYGQRKNHKKIKSLKVAFITEKLDLSSKEAQNFWPIYNEYQEKRETLRQKKRTEIKGEIKEVNELPENEAKELLEKYIRFKDEEDALGKTFLKEVSKVIAAKKTLLLLRSEKEFKRQLIRQYRHKKGGQKR